MGSVERETLRAGARGADGVAAVGATIRRLRREQGLSLRDVAGLTGFSIGFLSLVERGRSSISLTSLHTVAKALGTEMAAFFAAAPPAEPDPPHVPHIVRFSDDEPIAIDRGHTYRLLGAPHFGRSLEPVLATIAPGDEPRDAYAHDGEEFVYLLSGRLVMIVDGAEYELASGDSIHYQSTVEHTCRNDSDEPAEALFVLTQRLF